MVSVASVGLNRVLPQPQPQRLQRAAVQFGSDPAPSTPPASGGGRGNAVKNIVLYLLAGLGLVGLGRESTKYFDTSGKTPAAAVSTSTDTKSPVAATTTVTGGSTSVVTTPVTGGSAVSTVPGGYGGYNNPGVINYSTTSGYLNDPGLNPSVFVPGDGTGVSGYLNDPGIGPSVTPTGGGYGK